MNYKPLHKELFLSLQNCYGWSILCIDGSLVACINALLQLWKFTKYYPQLLKLQNNFNRRPHKAGGAFGGPTKVDTGHRPRESADNWSEQQSKIARLRTKWHGSIRPGLKMPSLIRYQPSWNRTFELPISLTESTSEIHRDSVLPWMACVSAEPPPLPNSDTKFAGKKKGSHKPISNSPNAALHDMNNIVSFSSLHFRLLCCLHGRLSAF